LPLPNDTHILLVPISHTTTLASSFDTLLGVVLTHKRSKRGFQFVTHGPRASRFSQHDVLSIALFALPLRHPKLCRRSKVRGGKCAHWNPCKIHSISTQSSPCGST
jgi:hypothetical protein